MKQRVELPADVAIAQLSLRFYISPQSDEPLPFVSVCHKPTDCRCSIRRNAKKEELMGRKRHEESRASVIRVADEPIKYWADYQDNWAGLIRPLRRGKYRIQSTANLSIHGDAPKCFVCIREYSPGRRTGHPCTWPKHIAKVGSKWYPIESITEHLLTRIGQACGVRVAESQLRVIGRQVRFLSRYFLRSKEESLVHAIEIFQEHLDEEMIEQIANERREQEFYTFQTVREALRYSFDENWESLMEGLVEMLAFDALVGNNDRHPANWGVIVSIRMSLPPRFAPVYDTARGLFWNNNEERVVAMLQNPSSLRAYVNKSCPQIGWDGVERLSHFDLVKKISKNYPVYRPILKKFSDSTLLTRFGIIIEEEFGRLLSRERRQLIHRCLTLRQELYHAATA